MDYILQLLKFAHMPGVMREYKYAMEELLRL